MFAHRLEIVMKLRGKNLTDIAESTGISKGTISKYLNGKMQPKQKQVIKIAECLNVNALYLLGFVDNASTESFGIRKSNIKEAVGLELNENDIIQKTLLDDINAICSRQDLETLKTMYGIIKTLAKK